MVRSTGSGQCHVVQEKGSAEFQFFPVFVSVSLALLYGRPTFMAIVCDAISVFLGDI